MVFKIMVPSPRIDTRQFFCRLLTLPHELAYKSSNVHRPGEVGRLDSRSHDPYPYTSSIGYFGAQIQSAIPLARLVTNAWYGGMG